jgi:transposase
LLLPGQRLDNVGVAPLLDGVTIGALIGDKAFDNDWLRRGLNERGALAVIPPKADRKTEIPCDFAMYRWRHLIEIFFCNLKQYRRIAAPKSGIHINACASRNTGVQFESAVGVATPRVFGAIRVCFARRRRV